MRLAGRLSAAIEILDDVLNRHRPAAMALSDWAKSHRFAGSGDRSAIGTLVYDALRRRASLGWRMGGETPRALVLGAVHHVWGMAPAEIEALCDGAQHAPAPLTEEEKAGLGRTLEGARGWVAADVPEWIFPSFEASFGERAIAEGHALAERAPIDLRVNTLKADRPRLLSALAAYRPEPTPFSPWGLRIAAPGPQQKNPNVEAEAAHGKGWFEVQDEASQIAMLLAGIGPRQQVIDLCAGSGGKTLAMAALMQNTGQIYAYDSEKMRLRPIFERLKRAGARNVQVMNAGDETALGLLEGRLDVVFVDAPCSGSGVWRRRPDAKWRLTAEALAQRIVEQRAVLQLAAPLVKPGGTLIYATCSVLPQENSEQTAWFLDAMPSFAEVDCRARWSISDAAPQSASGSELSLQLTPSKHATDGFFVSILTRQA
jgi:16S rRNA (cytosine967-C5)-methyltransferase